MSTCNHQYHLPSPIHAYDTLTTVSHHSRMMGVSEMIVGSRKGRVDAVPSIRILESGGIIIRRYGRDDFILDTYNGNVLKW